MKDFKKTRTTASLLQFALFVPALAFGQAANGVFHFQVPVPNRGPVSIGFKDPALGYETLLPESSILEVQYAILHALTNWGNAPDYKTHDQALLTRAGIQVSPLDTPSSRILEDKLVEIRRERSAGIPTVDNHHHPISLQQMAMAHRALIAAYQQKGNVKYLAPGTASYGKSSVTPEKRVALLQSLADGIATMANVPPADNARWNAAAASVNATLAQFGHGDAVDPAALRADAVNDALNVYDRELSAAKAEAATSGHPLSLAETAVLRNKYNAMFDGSRGPAVYIPSGAQMTSGIRNSEQSFNAQPAAPATVVPPPAKKPASSGGDQPGFFGILGGLLGSLFGGLFRTVGRVVVAAVHGVLGVAKALFS